MIAIVGENLVDRLVVEQTAIFSTGFKNTTKEDVHLILRIVVSRVVKILVTG